MQSRIPWQEVTELFGKVQYVSIATVDAEGFPRISPIGSVRFTTEGHGYYFEKFPQSMRENLERNSCMSIMAVHPAPGFWIKSLWKGKFQSQPAIRLVCKAGLRRRATPDEITYWLSRVRTFRFFKGHDLLWKDMSMVREFEVLSVDPVELGRMNP